MKMKTLEDYHGYGAEVTWSEPDNCWYGILTGTSDFVDFEAATEADIEREFRAAADSYMDTKKIILRQKPGRRK